MGSFMLRIFIKENRELTQDAFRGTSELSYEQSDRRLAKWSH